MEHIFDNHQHCEFWCQAKGKAEEEKKQKGLVFRRINDPIDKQIYNDIKQSVDPFLTENALKTLKSLALV